MAKNDKMGGEELIDLLRKLVSIDSVNPGLVPGAGGEGEIARFVASWLEAQGLDVRLEEAVSGRPNVVAVARGSGGGRSLMLNAHMDTVGAGRMKDPFRPSLRGNRLFGRGALDTKGALAAFMMAAARAASSGLRGDVILAAVIDEEYASAGTEALAGRWRADAAIVGEPTGLEIVVAHKGFAWLEIETEGTAAHGSRPDLGVDAIAKMGKVLVAIDRLSERLSRSKPHPLLGTGSIHASIIRGGQELSSYPASCQLSVERRTIPGEAAGDTEAELQAMLDEIEREDPEFYASVRLSLARDPLEMPNKAPIVEAMARQVREIAGREPVLSGMGGWMDSAILAGAGIPCVVFGPAGEGLHADVEWVDITSVRQCNEIVLATILDFCR
jgi:acetylornithine deacetylase